MGSSILGHCVSHLKENQLDSLVGVTACYSRLSPTIDLEIGTLMVTLAVYGQCLDWCQYIVTGQDSNFNLH